MIYKRLGYNLVSYDSDPLQWVEPVNESFSTDMLDTASQGTVVDAMTHYGRVNRFEYYDGRPFEGITNGAEFNVDGMTTSFGLAPNDFDRPRSIDT